VGQGGRHFTHRGKSAMARKQLLHLAWFCYVAKQQHATWARPHQPLRETQGAAVVEFQVTFGGAFAAESTLAHI
jgi:hypothetical protein